MSRFVRNARFQLLEIAKKFEEMEQEIVDTGLITKSEACEWAKRLVTDFCHDEWSEATCVYFDRHMLGKIRCIECDAEMPVEQIDLRYCDKCHEELEFSWRLTLMDI